VGVRRYWRILLHSCSLVCRHWLPKAIESAHEHPHRTEDASWTELAYRLEVRADIEEGLADVKAGRVVSTTELRREFNLPE
jgi:hypothetical protein